MLRRAKDSLSLQSGLLSSWIDRMKLLIVHQSILLQGQSGPGSPVSREDCYFAAIISDATGSDEKECLYVEKNCSQEPDIVTGPRRLTSSSVSG